MKTTIHPQTDFLQGSPMQYINQAGALEDAGLFIRAWGARAFISAGRNAYNAICKKLEASLQQYAVPFDVRIFSGECSDANIGAVVQAARAFGCEVLVCAGGGKALDTGKAAASLLGVPVVCIPTIAATCAAASALSVLYTDEGEFLRDEYYPQNPNLVLCDPQVIANAPAKYLHSGIIDSLSKWYEGNAAFKGIADPDIATQSAIHLAALLNDRLLQEGKAASRQVEQHIVGPELVKTIDLCVYLTAVIQSFGQASTRGAAAHPIQGGMSLIPESHRLLHGEKVAYGIIVQLFMEGKPKAEIESLARFFLSLGVTPSLAALGMPADEDTMLKIAAKSNRDPLMRKMPVPVDEAVLLQAMRRTEAFVAALT